MSGYPPPNPYGSQPPYGYGQPPQTQPGFPSTANPGYPPQASAPGYPSQPGTYGYPPQTGAPGYPPQHGTYGYSPQTGVPGYPPQAGVPGYPSQADAPGYSPQTGAPVYPPQAGAPGYPSQTGAPGYPPQAGAPGYPPQAGAPGYPPQPGTYGYPPQAGAPGYPPQAGAPGYPSQTGAPGYPPQTGALGYPSQAAAPGYPPQAGAPGYPPQTGAPGYPHQAGAPGYPPQAGAPGYPPQTGVPGHSPQTGVSGYPPQTGAPGYPQYSAPGYPYTAAPGGYAQPTSNDPHASFNPHHHAPSKEPPVHGTVHPVGNFDPEGDSRILHKAMKGFGTDEKTIIDLIAKRSNPQRIEILSKFKVLYGKDLISELKSELSGNFENLVIALFQPTIDYDCQLLRKAMKGAGTDELALIEIMVSRSNQDVLKIKQRYKQIFSRDLEKDLVSETSGHFKRLLVSLCQGAREEGAAVDQAKALQEAQDLFNAGERRWGTDESRFNQVLALRSFPQLNATFNEYKKIAQRDILSSIDREMSGDLKAGMQAVVKVVMNRYGFFAERLYKSMKGLGTDDDALIRTVVTRCEVDMVEIKHEYMKMYKKSLATSINSDCSGDYLNLLVALVGRD